MKHIYEILKKANIPGGGLDSLLEDATLAGNVRRIEYVIGLSLKIIPHLFAIAKSLDQALAEKPSTTFLTIKGKEETFKLKGPSSPQAKQAYLFLKQQAKHFNSISKMRTQKQIEAIKACLTQFKIYLTQSISNGNNHHSYQRYSLSIEQYLNEVLGTEFSKEFYEFHELQLTALLIKNKLQSHLHHLDQTLSYINILEYSFHLQEENRLQIVKLQIIKNTMKNRK